MTVREIRQLDSPTRTTSGTMMIVSASLATYQSSSGANMQFTRQDAVVTGGYRS